MIKVFFAFTLLLTAHPAAALQIQKITSPQGITAWLVEDHHHPLLAVSAVWEKRPDPKNHSGTTALMTALLDEGSANMDWNAFHAALEDHSISMRFDSDHENIYGEMRSLTKNKKQAFRLFAQAITQPRFDAASIEKIRRQLLTVAKSREQNLGSFARQAWYQAAFGTQPYAFPVEGLAADLTKIKRQTLLRRHKRIFTRANLSLSVVGDITPQELALALDEMFGKLPHGKSFKPSTKKLWRKNGKLIQRIRASPQTIIYFGFPGLKRDHPDFIKYYVMNHILGGGSEGLLSSVVRERKGLVYSIYSATHSFRDGGFILGTAATRNHQVKDTLRLIRAIFSRLRTRGISEQQLTQAKSYLIGSYGLNFDNSLSIARNLTSIQRQRLGIDYIERRQRLINEIRLADINRQIKKFLRTEKMIILTAGGKNRSQPKNRLRR